MDEKPRRRWFGFGLISLFALIAAIGVLVRFWNPFERQSILDGEWQFSRLISPNSQLILNEWRGVTLVIKRNKAILQNGPEITECDFSVQVVNETQYIVFKSVVGETRFLYDLSGNTLLLSFLPHSVPTSLNEGIVVEFKRGDSAPHS